jgi:hypothetical protein
VSDVPHGCGETGAPVGDRERGVERRDLERVHLGAVEVLDSGRIQEERIEGQQPSRVRRLGQQRHA